MNGWPRSSRCPVSTTDGPPPTGSNTNRALRTFCGPASNSTSTRASLGAWRVRSAALAATAAVSEPRRRAPARGDDLQNLGVRRRGGHDLQFPGAATDASTHAARSVLQFELGVGDRRAVGHRHEPHRPRQVDRNDRGNGADRRERVILQYEAVDLPSPPARTGHRGARRAEPDRRSRSSPSPASPAAVRPS